MVGYAVFAAIFLVGAIFFVPALTIYCYDSVHFLVLLSFVWETSFDAPEGSKDVSEDYKRDATRTYANDQKSNRLKHFPSFRYCMLNECKVKYLIIVLLFSNLLALFTYDYYLS